MKTSPSQFEILVTYMEQHGDLSKLSTSNARDKITSIRNWEELTALLNSDGAGATKTLEKWKKAWSDFKNNTKRKAARLHRAASGTGGGPAVFAKLTDLEQRVLNLIGLQVATGLAVEEAGLSQEVPIQPSPNQDDEQGKILAPIVKKPAAGLTGKSGTGLAGKSGAGLTGKSGSLALGGSSSSTSGMSGRIPSKSYATATHGSPKSNKSSMGFGIVWIPSKKRNKKKDVVYSPHQSNQPKDKLDRAPSMYNYMSGDSPEYQPFKKKEEETDLLVHDRAKLPISTVASASATVEVPSDISGSTKPDENTEFIRHDNEDSKEAAGDTNEKDIKKDGDYLENDNLTNKSPDSKWDKDKLGDKVDSVYLRPPPPHKARSNASTPEEEDCGIKCLYYTLQCCDCVLM